jgi:hypothetical protein
MPKRLTQEEFITKAKDKHGDRYGYFKFVNGGYEKKSTITCYIHGEFEQTPHAHLRQGCEKCGIANRTTSLEEFIAKARLIHGDKYSYLKSIYVRFDKKLTITCDIHGDFQQTPAGHLAKRKSGKPSGCPKCGVITRAESFQKTAYEKKLTLEEFLERAQLIHGDKYSYFKFIFVDRYTRGFITCKIHGDFEQTPAHHLDNHGCFDCSVDESRLTFEEFKLRAFEMHHNTYNYDKAKDIFVDSVVPIPIDCSKHGTFYQKPINHYLIGTGCPICNVAGSNEELIFLMLKENEINFKHDYYLKKIDKSEKREAYLDFYFPDINVVIEYNGIQHYKPSKFGENLTDDEANQKLINQQERDKYVENFCQSHNIDIIWIDGREYFGHSLKKHIVSLLLSLGLLTTTEKYNWYK